MVRQTLHLRYIWYDCASMNGSGSSGQSGRRLTDDWARVVDTAMCAYQQEDRASVSVNAICTLAKVSKPSLYRAFGSEDGLTAAVLERYEQVLWDSVEAVLASPTTYGDKLDAMIGFASEDPRMVSGCLYVKMRATRSRFGLQTQARIAAVESRLLDRYACFFREAGLLGAWRGGINAELAAEYLHEQIGLAFTQRAAGKSSAYVRELLALAMLVLR